jgi:hypothetical protein
MVKQQGGTLAGEKVAYGEFYDNKSDQHWGYDGTGFQFFKNVERDEKPAESFNITWSIYRKEDTFMRLHNLTQVDEVALSDGEPSRGRPDRIRYSLRSRFGDDLESQFISVIEPYQGDPLIDHVKVLERIEEKGQPFAVAVEVTLKDGRKDTILVREEAGKLSVDELFLNGRLGLVRHNAAGELETIVAIAADEVRSGSEVVYAPPITGRLKGFDDSNPLNVRLQLETDSPLSEELVGRYIIIDNKEIADGSYRIEAIESPDILNLGQTSLAERLADPKDFDAGVLYNIQPGDPFLIPSSASWQRN